MSINGQDANMKYIVFKKGIDSEAFQNCTGVTRNMYVTITRTKVTIPDAVSLTSESRMLQSSKEKVTLTFDVYQGENSSVKLFGSLVVASVMAFLSFAF